MITFTEFFLFVALIFTISYAMFWRFEARRVSHLFKLMLTNEDARRDILHSYQAFLRTQK